MAGVRNGLAMPEAMLIATNYSGGYQFSAGVSSGHCRRPTGYAGIGKRSRLKHILGGTGIPACSGSHRQECLCYLNSEQSRASQGLSVF